MRDRRLLGELFHITAEKDIFSMLHSRSSKGHSRSNSSACSAISETPVPNMQTLSVYWLLA